MKLQFEQFTENVCPRRDLAAYIDGELSQFEEIELDAHLVGCQICAVELNEQKRLSCALDFVLEGEKEFPIPANFTKIVVANAESKVSGLRSPKERLNAIFVIAALFLIFLLGIGGEIKSFVSAFLQFGEQAYAVAGFAGHLIYDLAVAASILLRSLGAQFIYNSHGERAVLFVFFAASLFALTRLLSRFRQSS